MRLSDNTIWTAGLVAGLLILAGLIAASVSRAATLEFEYTRPALLWKFVCATNQDECRDLPAPAVEYAPLHVTMGLIGGFSLDDVSRIVVDIPEIYARYASRVMVDSVLVHEMQHYYDFHRGNITVPYDASRCEVEQRGFSTQAVYLFSHGGAEFVDYTWNERYGC